MLKHLAFAGAMALALMASPVTGQVATRIVVPPERGAAPMEAPCVKQADGSCVPVSAAAPLPTAPAYSSAASWTDGTAAQDVRGYETAEIEVTSLTAGQTITITRSIGGSAYVAHWLIGNDLATHADGVISANGIYTVTGRGYLKYALSGGSASVSLQARN